MTAPPAALSSAVGLLQHRGEKLLEPGSAEFNDLSLHPLLVPLTRTADGETTGLLRWPAAGGGSSKLPLVRTRPGQQLELLADSLGSYVARAAAVADAAGDADAADLAALAETAGVPYAAGSAAASAGGVSGYVVLKIGPFVEEYENLANGHLAKGADGITAALVTCDRSESCFAAWGRPFAFHARMLSGIEGREEEARDKARAALEMPLWTLGDDLGEISAMAQIEDSALIDKLLLKAEGGLTAQELRMKNNMETRSPQQVAKDRASYLLDLVVAQPSKYTWEGVRPDLAARYEEAGMKSIASWVAGGA